MWPFKPKAKVETNGSWMLGQGQLGDDTFFIRMQTMPRGEGTLTHRIGIAIPFPGTIDNQYPNRKTATVLAKIEDSLVEYLEPVPSEFVIALTLPKVRELVFYTSRPDDAVRKLEAVRLEWAPAVIQHYVEHDPAWSVYHEFKNRVRSK